MLQNLLKNYAQNSAWKAVFFSIEMPIASVVERYHEILGGMLGKEVEGIYLAKEEGAEGYREKLEADFIKDLEGLYVIPVKVSVSDIASYVALIEQTYSVKVGLVGVDYLGLLDGPGSNEYEVVSKLARGIKTTAKILNLPVILLSQVSRKGGGGEVEISLDMGRGSGAIEEGADFILGLWQAERPKLSVEDSESDYDLICRVLKNRKGPKGSRWKLDLDPTNLRIGPDAEPWEPPNRRKGGLRNGDTL
jgi:replicative DNA helicase